MAAARRPQKGSMGTDALGAKVCRGRVLGVEYPGGGCTRGGQMRQDAKRAASNASGRIGRGPFTSSRNEPWRTHPEQEFTL